jgi:hypothetical protein
MNLRPADINQNFNHIAGLNAGFLQLDKLVINNPLLFKISLENDK